MFKRTFAFVVVAVVIAVAAFALGAYLGPGLGLGPGPMGYGMGPWMHAGGRGGFGGMPFGMGMPFGWIGFLLFGGLQLLFWVVVIGLAAWLVARLVQPRAPAPPSQTPTPTDQA